MEITIKARTAEEFSAWVRVTQLSENEEDTEAAIAWLKSKNSNGESVNILDLLHYLEHIHHCRKETKQ